MPQIGAYSLDKSEDRYKDVPTPEIMTREILKEFCLLHTSAWQSVWFALYLLGQRLGSSVKVILLQDTVFAGSVPLKLGADLPPGIDSRDNIKTIGIGITPTHWASPERTPWGSGWPHDVSPEGIARNIAEYREREDPDLEAKFKHVLCSLNCSQTLDSVLDLYAPKEFRRPLNDVATIFSDVKLQFCLPCQDFPSSDWPDIKLVGTLPIKPLPTNLAYPEWWDEITENSAKASTIGAKRKRIIVVAQGTMQPDFDALAIPTIQALADNTDFVVVAILGFRGKTLDEHLHKFPAGVLPSNARVLDHFPYDAVLAHADIFISCSGYGGMTHGNANGVPMIQTGVFLDKPVIGLIIEHCGLGIYLREYPPSVESLRSSVDQILGDSKFPKRAMELKAESEQAKPLEALEREILAIFT